MATLMQLANPLAVEDRGLFLRDIAARLQDEPAIGDGVVIRIAREVQRRYLKPVEPVETRRRASCRASSQMRRLGDQRRRGGR